MSEDKSDLFQALLEIRVRLDVFEDLLAQELGEIRDALDTDKTSEAYNRLNDLVRMLESDND